MAQTLWSTRSRGRWARGVGVVAGLVMARVAGGADPLGRGVLLAAPLFGLATVAGVLVGEVATGRAVGSTRRASLRARHVVDYVPRALAVTVAGVTAILVVLMIAGVAAGAPDDLGRAGRSLARQCDAVTSMSHGPWPGSFYAGPLAIVLLAGAVLTGVAVARIARRPPDPSLSPSDEAARRESAAAVAGAWGVLVTIPMVGIAVTMAGCLHGIDCGPRWWDTAALALAALVPLGGGVLLWSAAAIVTPLRGPGR